MDDNNNPDFPEEVMAADDLDYDLPPAPLDEAFLAAPDVMMPEVDDAQPHLVIPDQGDRLPWGQFPRPWEIVDTDWGGVLVNVCLFPGLQPAQVNQVSVSELI